MDRTHPKFNEDFIALRTNPAAGDGQHEYFMCSDGARLFMQYWLPPSGQVDRVLLCLHGMSAHGWYFSLTADEVVPHNTAVYVPDYRHHGLSDGVKGDMTDPFLLVKDIRELAVMLKRRHPGAKFFVLGESMGGAVNINFHVDMPGFSDGMVLLAPAVAPAMKFSLRDMLMLPLLVLVHLLWPKARVVKVTGEEHRGMRNPANIRYDQNDPLHLKFVTPRYMLSVKKLLDRGRKLGPGSITVPVLVFQGGMDTAVSSQATLAFYESLKSGDKTLKYYPDGFHCMQTDPVTGDLRGILREWLLAR